MNTQFQGQFNNVTVKKQYKTSSIVAAILMQPIFVAIILGLILFQADNYSIIITIAGSVVAVIIDVVLLLVLFNPKNKVVIGSELNSVNQHNDYNRVNINQINNSNNNYREANNEIYASSNNFKNVERFFDLDEETNLLDEETNLLDEETNLLDDGFFDEGTVLIEEEIFAKLEIDNGITKGEEEIKTDSFIIGRQSQLREWISNSGVSRQHIEIFKLGEDYFLRDLKSKNGTKINGIRVPMGAEEKLNDGDVIEIPDLILTFKL